MTIHLACGHKPDLEGPPQHWDSAAWFCDTCKEYVDVCQACLYKRLHNAAEWLYHPTAGCGTNTH